MATHALILCGSWIGMRWQMMLWVGCPFLWRTARLCGAGIVFDGRASDGVTYTFGSSGFLFRSNKLMYDRQTRTLWNQLTGEPVLGELVGSGIKLDLLPVVVTTWEAWLSQHPDTVVLDTDTGYSRPYYPGAAYGDYFADEDHNVPGLAAQRSTGNQGPNLCPAN